MISLQLFLNILDVFNLKLHGQVNIFRSKSLVMKRLAIACLMLLFGMTTYVNAQTDDLEVVTIEAEETKKKKSKKKQLELTEEHRTRLAFEGIRSGDIDMAKKYIFPQLYFKFDQAGETPLTLAIQTGNVAMVELIEQHAIINRKNKAGETPLTLAIKSQNTAIIDIVTTRAKASLKNKAGEVPIVLAMQHYNQLSYLKQLIEKGADLNAHHQGLTPLSVATAEENLPIVALLLKNGADPSIPNQDGTIPLALAVQQDQEAIAGMLIYQSKDEESDVNWKTDLGEPLIVLAAAKGQPNTVRNLLNAGAASNATDYLNNTALIMAASTGNEVIIKTLVEHGADLNHQNMLGITPITAAAEAGHLKSATYLADNGADAALRSFSGLAASDFYSFVK